LRRFLIIFAILLTAAVAGTGPAPAATATFTDVPASYWAAPAVTALAGRGIVHGFPDGSFKPGNPVTRAQFAALLDAALNLAPASPPTPTFRDVPRSYWGYGVVETAVAAGIIHGTGAGIFGPDRPVTRQDMAVMLANALHLTAVTRDLAAAGTSFADNKAIASYAVGSVSAANRLQLIKGLPDGRFQPAADTTRAQAAQVVYGLMNLPPRNVAALAAGFAQKIVITAPSSPLDPGQTVTLTAAVYDGQGRLLPVQPTWSASGGTITPSGVLTATLPGQPVIVTAGLNSASGLVQTSATVLVASASSLNPVTGPPGTVAPGPAAAALSVAVPSPAAITAGGTVTVSVQVLDGQGNPFPADQGRAITLTVTSPSYHNGTYAATDTGGTAVFTVSGTLAGTYTLQATASGLTSSTPVTFQVNPGPPDHLQLAASPSTLVVPGRPVQITAAVVDAYGNVTTAASPAAVTLSTGGYGTFAPAATNIAGNTVVGTFTANGRTGSTTLRLTTPGTAYPPATLTLSSLASPAALVAGKGMWLLYDDWRNIPDAQIIATAQADHVTHLYLEVAATATGFYGQPGLVDLLPQVHAAHIALVAWIYTSLGDPVQDAALAAQVAGFRTPGGDGVDGLAADLEENLDPGNISSFAASARQALGQNYLLAAVVYPPQSNPGKTYAAMYRATAAFTVLAPMDYWHNTPTTFTAAQAGQYVAQSLQMLPGLTGGANLPVEVVGQAYNMFTSGNYAPSGDEETAAMAAARAGGAIGYSMYRWGTATPAEWQAFANYDW